MSNHTDIIIGFEAVVLNPDDPGSSPLRLTIDYQDRDGKIHRSQYTGRPTPHTGAEYGATHERTLEELARVQLGTEEERMEIARKLDELDRVYCKNVRRHAEDLFIEQVRVLHGDEGVEFLVSNE